MAVAVDKKIELLKTQLHSREEGLAVLRFQLVELQGWIDTEQLTVNDLKLKLDAVKPPTVKQKVLRALGGCLAVPADYTAQMITTPSKIIYRYGDEEEVEER